MTAAMGMVFRIQWHTKALSDNGKALIHNSFQIWIARLRLWLKAIQDTPISPESNLRRVPGDAADNTHSKCVSRKRTEKGQKKDVLAGNAVRYGQALYFLPTSS